MATKQQNSKPSATIYTLDEGLYTPSEELAQAFSQNRQLTRAVLFIRTYAPLEALRDVISTLDAYALIVHDRDTKPDGTPKEAHIHLLAYRKKGHRITLYKGLPGNTFVDVPKNKRLAYEYLLHKNHPDKHQYSEKDILAENPGYFYDVPLSPDEAKQEANENFLEDLENLTRRELAIKYGRDYIKNFRAYEDFLHTLRRDDVDSDLDRLTEAVEASSGDVLADTYAFTLSDKLDALKTLIIRSEQLNQLAQYATGGSDFKTLASLATSVNELRKELGL